AGSSIAVVLAGKRDSVTFFDAGRGGLGPGRGRRGGHGQRDQRRGSSKGKHSLHGRLRSELGTGRSADPSLLSSDRRGERLQRLAFFFARPPCRSLAPLT